MDKFQKYRDAIEHAFAELTELTKRKKSIDEDMSKFLQLAVANIAMLPASERKAIAEKLESLKEPSGLSDAVMRGISFTDYMSAAEVRDALTKSGYDLDGQVNPLASIHTTLRRLAADGRIDSKNEGGRSVYRRLRTLPPLKGLRS